MPVFIQRHALWLPLRGCSIQPKFFSTSQCLPSAAATALRGRRPPPMQSMKAQRDKMMERPDFPDLVSEIGIISGTYARPLPSQLPSFTSKLSERLQVEKTYIKSRLIGFASLLTWKFSMRPKRKGVPRPPFAFRERIPKAISLYTNLFTSFANGDVSSIRKIANPGLYQSLTERIDSRSPTQKQSWKVIKDLSPPTVVSDRAAKLPVPMPGINHCAIRQVVVRLHTQQQLEKWTRKLQRKTASPETAEPENEAEKQTQVKEVVEYMILQKRMWQGEIGPWKIWGFTNPTTLETWAENEKKAADLQAYAAQQRKSAS